MKDFENSGINIDNYIIPLGEVTEYIKRRNNWREFLLDYFKPYFHKVDTAFAGSQDGEAIVGYNDKGELKFLYHLDPYNLKLLDEAQANQQLEYYLEHLK